MGSALAVPVAVLFGAALAYALLRIARSSQQKEPPKPAPPSPSEAEEFRRFFTLTIDLLCIADTKGRFLKLNKSWETTLGYSVEELEGKLFLDLVHPEDLPATLEALKSLSDQIEVRDFVNRYRCKDGSYRWIEWRSHAAGPIIYAAARDITVARQVQDALRDSEERYRSLFEDSPSVMLLLDPETGQIMQANDAACNYYGYPREILTSMRITDINRLSPEAVLAELQRAKVEQRMHFFFEHRLASGEIREVEVFSGPIRFRGRDLLHSVIHDIHERRLAEDALHASEDKYRTLTEQLGEGLAVVGLSDGFSYCNRKLAEMLGYSQEELQDMNPPDIVMESQRELVRTKLNERREGKNDRYELQLRKKDGTPLDVLITVNPLFDAKGSYSGSLALFTNIVEQKRAEETARKIQKSESLNLMAGGIAHDFNNLFQAIQGNLEMALVNAGEPGKVKASLDRALRILGDSAALSRKILDYSGKGFRRAVLVDLRHLLISNMESLKGLVSPRIEFRLRIEEDLPRVEGDPDQILQVVSGLIANASESIEKDGWIELALDRARRPEGQPPHGHWIEPPPATDVVRLAVRDSGRGIPPGDIGRIFDPFFSTKAAGRGMELPAALGIVRNHKAGLLVASSPKGTLFQICFEASGGEDAAESSPVPAQATVAKTVLLVDDDADLREVLTESLRDMLGYQVLEAKDGQEAVELFKENAGRISLILMDAVMPRLSGGKAFEAIKKIQPEAVAILCSGYGDDVGNEALAKHGFKGFLKKPFSIKDLAAAIEKALAPS